MTDKELTEAGDNYIALEIKETSLSQEYHNRFKEILPPAKILRLYQAENQYKLQLLNELQNRKHRAVVTLCRDSFRQLTGKNSDSRF